MVFKKIMRKGLKILTWIGIAAWFVVILGFVSAESEEVLCNRIEVILSDTVQSRFITESTIRDLFREGGLELQGYPLSQINTREMEALLEENAYVKGAEVNTDITGRMEVRIDQRIPLLRIMPRGERGFYMDTEGQMMPLSDQFTPHILLLSGYLGGQHGGGTMEGIVSLFFLCLRAPSVERTDCSDVQEPQRGIRAHPQGGSTPDIVREPG